MNKFFRHRRGGAAAVDLENLQPAGRRVEHHRAGRFKARRRSAAGEKQKRSLYVQRFRRIFRRHLPRFAEASSSLESESQRLFSQSSERYCQSRQGRDFAAGGVYQRRDFRARSVGESSGRHDDRNRRTDGDEIPRPAFSDVFRRRPLLSAARAFAGKRYRRGDDQ
jgi:hypothetical protein